MPSTEPGASCNPSRRSWRSTGTRSPRSRYSNSRPYTQRLTFEAVKELAEAIEKPPYLWNESQLWQAYAALEKSKVRGAGDKRILTDLVSLVRFAMHQENELVPFPERVNANFRVWLREQEKAGRKFDDEQRRWLEMIRDHIAGSLGIDMDDFELSPFAQAGGLGWVYQLFGADLGPVLDDLARTLVARPKGGACPAEHGMEKTAGQACLRASPPRQAPPYSRSHRSRNEDFGEASIGLRLGNRDSTIALSSAA